jgi:hypothetical protein
VALSLVLAVAGFTGGFIAFGVPLTQAKATGVLVSAAEQIEQATAAGGAGYTFETGSQQVYVAVPGGDKVIADDPAHPGTSIRVDRSPVTGALTRGMASPDGFAMSLRLGVPENDLFAWDQGTPFVDVISQAGSVWRNDGQGWIATSVPPGLGFDPLSAARLPTLLRDMQRKATDLGMKDGLHGYRADVSAADYPGIIASDLLSATADPVTVSAWIDATGHLARIDAVGHRIPRLGPKEPLLQAEVTTRFGFPTTPVVIPVPSPLVSEVPAP